VNESWHTSQATHTHTSFSSPLCNEPDQTFACSCVFVWCVEGVFFLQVKNGVDSVYACVFVYDCGRAGLKKAEMCALETKKHKRQTLNVFFVSKEARGLKIKK